MKWMDMPPVWLVGFLALGWAQDRLWPLIVPGDGMRRAGAVLVAAGFALFLAAGVQFLRARTTIVPREAPEALITGGIYRFSRNPIYLGDLLIFVGMSLAWGAVLSLLLAPVFVRVITARFVVGEEARLEAAFGDDYRAYRRSVRRWL